MTAAPGATNDFRFVGGPWRKQFNALVAGLLEGVGLLALGCGVVIFGGWLPWESYPAWCRLLALVSVLPAAGVLVLFGFVALWAELCDAVSWVARRRVVRITHEGLWIWVRAAWWSKFVPFASVVSVIREQLAAGVDYVRIIHGPDRSHDAVSADEICPADYDALLALLADRCPAAFAPGTPP